MIENILIASFWICVFGALICTDIYIVSINKNIRRYIKSVRESMENDKENLTDARCGYADVHNEKE